MSSSKEVDRILEDLQVKPPINFNIKALRFHSYTDTFGKEATLLHFGGSNRAEREYSFGCTLKKHSLILKPSGKVGRCVFYPNKFHPLYEWIEAMRQLFEAKTKTEGTEYSKSAWWQFIAPSFKELFKTAITAVMSAGAEFAEQKDIDNAFTEANKFNEFMGDFGISYQEECAYKEVYLLCYKLIEANLKALREDEKINKGTRSALYKFGKWMVDSSLYWNPVEKIDYIKRLHGAIDMSLLPRKELAESFKTKAWNSWEGKIKSSGLLHERHQYIKKEKEKEKEWQRYIKSLKGEEDEEEEEEDEEEVKKKREPFFCHLDFLNNTVKHRNQNSNGSHKPYDQCVYETGVGDEIDQAFPMFYVRTELCLLTLSSKVMTFGKKFYGYLMNGRGRDTMYLTSRPKLVIFLDSCSFSISSMSFYFLYELVALR
ncbi:hypothetical protein CCACVL1_07046 [Corchorus capsularis]|uniref:Uncharacterized protein n=1 Tax=Corchorus capsularis TaxID=210143 RepID=A0A1R3JA54_COCAP|nr:hypothetical protein CCACVL1_07046 [Corchorus capsularis]